MKQMGKKIVALCLFSVIISGCLTEQETELPTIDILPEEIREVNRSVFQWQMSNHPKKKWQNDWFNAALYHGVTKSAKVFDYLSYWETAKRWAEYHHWEIGKRKLHADDQASAASYLNLYQYFGPEKNMIKNFRAAVNTMVAGNDNEWLWDWVDALYMGPVPIAKLANYTSNKMYFDLLNTHYWVTYDRLYSEDYDLFYRDERFLNKKDSMGNPIFWSRGNGWVIGGLVEILKQLPKEDPSYYQYRHLFSSMMARIVELQGEDGLWRTNLLSPSIYPNPETSGSAFFAYGLAWGIRNHIITDKKYKRSLVKVWKGLTNHIDEFGKLGSAQTANIEPDHVDPNNSELYASGAFLLASAELYQLLSSVGKGGSVK